MKRTYSLSVLVSVILCFSLASSALAEDQAGDRTQIQRVGGPPDHTRVVVPRPPLIAFQGAISVEDIGGGSVRVKYYAFADPSFPVGTPVDISIHRPDGGVYLDSPRVFPIPDQTWVLGKIWEGPFPEDFGKGFVIFRVTFAFPGKMEELWTNVPVGMSPDTKVGPLDDALVDGQGGVTLLGTFAPPLTVVAPDSSLSAVVLKDGNYIPPSAIGHGKTMIVACSRDKGCTTVWRNLP